MNVNVEAEKVLCDLERLWRSGRLTDPDYRRRKWQLLKWLCEKAQLVRLPDCGMRTEETTDSLGNPFCYLDGGMFIFGPEDDFSELKAPIYISKYPVTVEQFTRFLEETGWAYSDQDWAILQQVSPRPDCPVANISWADAKAYCRWLRKVTHQYYSLPHEIEWERAARGIDGRLYPWGNEDPSPELACYQGDVWHESTMPLNSYPSNVSPVGCVDMVGNVWEWCLDSSADPTNPHMLRGGAWCSAVEYCNCIARTYSLPPEKRVEFGGFRLTWLPDDIFNAYQQQYAPEGTMPMRERRQTHNTVILQVPQGGMQAPEALDGEPDLPIVEDEEPDDSSGGRLPPDVAN